MQNKLLFSRAFDQMVYCSHNSCHLNILWKKVRHLPCIIHVNDGKSKQTGKCISLSYWATFYFYRTLHKSDFASTCVYVTIYYFLFLSFLFLFHLFFKVVVYNHSPSCSLWMQNPDGRADGAWKIGWNVSDTSIT